MRGVDRVRGLTNLKRGWFCLGLFCTAWLALAVDWESIPLVVVRFSQFGLPLLREDLIPTPQYNLGAEIIYYNN